MSLLSLIPKPLHRVLYRLAFNARKLALRILRHDLTGCSIVGLDREGRILLVRHSYGLPQWTVPGGGMRKGEDPVKTALREIDEELSCTLHEPRYIAKMEESFHGGTNHVHVVTGLVVGEPEPDQREILEAGFFAFDNLPETVSPVVKMRLEVLLRESQA